MLYLYQQPKKLGTTDDINDVDNNGLYHGYVCG